METRLMAGMEVDDERVWLQTKKRCNLKVNGKQYEYSYQKHSSLQGTSNSFFLASLLSLLNQLFNNEKGVLEACSISDVPVVTCDTGVVLENTMLPSVLIMLFVIVSSFRKKNSLCSNGPLKSADSLSAYGNRERLGLTLKKN